MKLAIEILKREIAQRELANQIDHLRKNEVQLELKSLEKALKILTTPTDTDSLIMSGTHHNQLKLIWYQKLIGAFKNRRY